MKANFYNHKQIAEKGYGCQVAKENQKIPTFFNFFWTSDEAHFHHEKRVNSKNNVFCSTSKTNKVAIKPLHSPKLKGGGGGQSHSGVSSDEYF